MPLHIYPSVYASESVPDNWTPLRGGALKYPVRNRTVLRELRRLRPGRWQKVIKQANFGEIHHCEHESGWVAGVKFLRK